MWQLTILVIFNKYVARNVSIKGVGSLENLKVAIYKGTSGLEPEKSQQILFHIKIYISMLKNYIYKCI